MAPEARTAAPQRSASARRKPARVSEPSGRGEMPCRAMAACQSGAAVVRWIASASRASTGAGVPAGATTAHHATISVPATPASAMVGTSGRAGLRRCPETASARARPAWICPSGDCSASASAGTCPAARSCSASAPPR